MAKNLGKKFEAIMGEAFKAYPNTSVDRIPDQTMRYKERKNVSDFIVFRFPFQYYIECKSVHGNTLPFKNITQIDALYEKAFILGVRAGVICWWVDKDITKWIPITEIAAMRNNGKKSIRWDEPIRGSKFIEGRKKRIYFEYDLSTFFD